MVFVKAKSGPTNVGDAEELFTVQYFDEKENMIIRSGGSRAWRCNNPGALLKSHYSMGKDRHAIGFAGYKKYVYAVYPDYRTGHEALIVMLKGSKYYHLTLEKASLRYVKEDPLHIQKVVKITKLDPKKTIQALSKQEFESYWKSLEQIEKWSVGREDFVERWYISGVHKKRGIISEYLINETGQNIWMSREEALKLALNNRLHVTIVHLRNGERYIRPEHGLKSFSIIVKEKC